MEPDKEATSGGLQYQQQVVQLVSRKTKSS